MRLPPVIDAKRSCAEPEYPSASRRLEEEGTVVLRFLIGMNAVVMDCAVVGESSIVAASAFVKAGAEIPARSLAAGMPAKVLRALSDEEIAWKVAGTRTYQDLTRRCLATLVEATPLSAVEPDRPRIALPDVVPLVELKKTRT